MFTEVEKETGISGCWLLKLLKGCAFEMPPRAGKPGRLQFQFYFGGGKSCLVALMILDFGRVINLT